MTITIGELIGVIFISAIAGFGIAMAVFYNIFKCSHEWEKIIDDHYPGACSHTVVHICKKCGKRKVTKV